MKRDGINYVVVGAFVAAGFALLLVGLALITGRSGSTTDYIVHYRNVTGLRYGAPVFYQGYRIGQVDAVVPERNADGTKYRVTLALRRDWPIPDDSPARLQSSGLLADVSIGIREGFSKKTLPAGGELKGEEGADVFAAMNELASEVSVLTRTELTPLIHTLGQRVDSITGSIDKTTPEILQQSLALVQRLNHASDSVNDLLKPENREAIAAVLAEARGLSHELHATRDKLDQALGDVAAMAKENRPDVRRAVEDLATVMAALSSRMDVISHHLESASRNVDEFAREIRKNPNRLILAPKADQIEDPTK